MRGGLTHQYLIAPFIGHATQLPGARVSTEYQVGPSIAQGAVDLFVRYGQQRIVVEAELTTRRVVWDIEKANALETTHLLIVMPTRSIVKAAKRCITAAGPIRKPPVCWLLPFGPALQRFGTVFPLVEQPDHLRAHRSCLSLVARECSS